MTEALGAQAAFVSRFQAGAVATAHTLAAVVDGEVVDGFDFDLPGTPCEQMLTSDELLVSRGVAEQYPGAEVLVALGAQGYMGDD